MILWNLQSEMANMARDYLEETSSVKNMQMELEAMGCMLDEARWVQNHYEMRVREQELKIEELEVRPFFCFIRSRQKNTFRDLKPTCLIYEYPRELGRQSACCCCC